MEQTYRPPLTKKETNWTPQRKYKRYSKKYSTYLGLIAYVIQNSPNKMLTFGQLMESLSTFVSGERKGLENNVRVCLSSNDCFVKVPVNPEYPNARRNYWKVDESRITPKMLRRHFSGTRDILTGLSSRVRAESDVMETGMKSTEIPPVLEDKRPVKFSSSFSIESLLRKDPEISSTSTLQTDATEDDLLRKGCNMKFKWDLISLPASFRDFSESNINSCSQRDGLAYHGTKCNGYTERLCKRAHLCPVVSYPMAGVSPYHNNEHMISLKRWSLSTNTFDSRNF